MVARSAAPVHGDFWPGNVLADGKGISVIDWGRFHFGDPTEDIFHFVSTLSFHRSRETRHSARTLLENFFGRSRLTQVAGEVTRATLARHGLGPDSVRQLFATFLVGRLAAASDVHRQTWREFGAAWVRAGFPEPFNKGELSALSTEEELTASYSLPSRTSRRLFDPR